MKIFIIAHEQQLNGATLSLIDIIKHLSQHHAITLFVPYRFSCIEDALERYNITIISRPYHRWMAPQTNWRYYAKKCLCWHIKDKRENAKVIHDLSEFVKQEQFDLLYTNTRVIDLGAQLSLKTKIPHIWHFREFGEEDFRLKPIGGYPAHWQRINQGTDLVIANSNAVAQKFRKLLREDLPVHVVYNGVDHAHLYDRTFSEQYDCVRFLMTGRISQAKGHPVMVKAVKALRAKGIDNFKVHVAGSGSISEIKRGKQSNAEDMANYIVALGQVRNIAEIRKTMQVELMCSKAEAFGRVTVEAMMSAMPVIGANSGGTTELIEDGVNGLLFENGNHLDLARKMEQLILHHAQINALGEAAQRIAKTNYSKALCCEKIEDEMQNVMGKLHAISK